jgi:hypothetical protein
MSDGQGSASDTPPGWAAEQPPPHAAPGGPPGTSPWAAPGAAPSASEPAAPTHPPAGPGSPQAAPPPPGGPPHPGFPSPGPAPYGAPPGSVPYGSAPPPPPGSPPSPYGGHPPAPAPYGPAPGYGPQYGYRPPPAALRPGIIPLRPLGLGDILDGTIKLIRSNPKSVLGMSAVAAALGALPVAIGQAMFTDSFGQALTDPTAAGDPPVAGVLGSYVGTLISVIIQFLAVTVLTGLLTRILGRAVFGGRITTGEAWRLTRGRLPALFGLALLTGLILLAPLVVVVALLIAVDAGGGDPVAVLGLLLLALILYIPYALFINTRLALAPPAVVLEGRSVVASLRRSWNLVTGDFWRVLGILVLTALMVAMISGILSLPFTLAGYAIGAFGGGGNAGAFVLTAVLIAAGTTIGSMIAYPIQAGVNGLLYADRRMRSEAFDLVLQTAAIEHQRQGWVHSSADDLWHPANAAAPERPGAM